MERYDVIVAGAGPAGSVLSYRIASRGASVLLLERYAFPRDKPCGGGVTIRAAQELLFDLTPVVEQVIYDVRFTYRLGLPFTQSYPAPLTFLTQRRRLDSYLVQQAVAAGVQFKDGLPVRSVTLEEGGVRVSAGGDVFSGRVLVGADGVNGVSGKHAGIFPDLEIMTALEGNFPCPTGIPGPWPRQVALDLGGLPGGYGWIFPKGDHLNIGVGAWQPYTSKLRSALEALCQGYGYDPASLESVRGYRLPTRKMGSPVARGPVLLVGDAAGLVDPLSGEGIHGAFLSARLASDDIIRYLSGENADSSAYEEAVDREIMPDIIVSGNLQALFYQMPAPYVALLRYSDRFWRSCCQLIRGEVAHRGFAGRLGPLRPVFDLMAGFAKRRKTGKTGSPSAKRRSGGAGISAS